MSEEVLLIKLIEPFGALYEDPQLAIDAKFQQAQKLIKALVTNEIDLTGDSLTDENYVLYQQE